VKTSPPITLAEDNRHVTSFRLDYERMFRAFEDKLMNEYEKIRTVYKSEYEENYRLNNELKTITIDRFNGKIEAKKEQMNDLSR